MLDQFLFLGHGTFRSAERRLLRRGPESLPEHDADRVVPGSLGEDGVRDLEATRLRDRRERRELLETWERGCQEMDTFTLLAVSRQLTASVSAAGFQADFKEMQRDRLAICREILAVRRKLPTYSPERLQSLRKQLEQECAALERELSEATRALEEEKRNGETSTEGRSKMRLFALAEQQLKFELTKRTDELATAEYELERRGLTSQ